jgi:predicted nucleic acid-binding Zn finger protein
MQKLELTNKSSKINQKTEQLEEIVSENKREVKGRALALSRNVYRLLGADVYYVQSERSEEIYYYVKYIFDSFEWCSCPDNSTRGIKCKHQFAIEYSIRLGTLKDIEYLPAEAKKYPVAAIVQQSKSYLEDDYDF